MPISLGSSMNPAYIRSRPGCAVLAGRPVISEMRDPTPHRVSRTLCDAEVHGHIGATPDCAARGRCLHHNRVHGRANAAAGDRGQRRPARAAHAVREAVVESATAMTLPKRRREATGE